MWTFDPWRAGSTAVDAWLAPYAGAESLALAQRRRLQALLEAAQASPLYRERYARHGRSLEAQPPVTKRELMERFDEWVTDPRLKLAALREFVADPSRIGEPFADDYAVWESSGSTGQPALFVQDAAAMAVYDVLEGLRRPATSIWRCWLDPAGVSERIAFVGATDGHFASTVSVERLRRLIPGMAPRLRGFSFLQPLRALALALERWQPSVIATYPTAALMLAEQRLAGRLKIAPREVWTGGEGLNEAEREVIASAFGCTVHASYGASEFLALASECAHRHLHLNSDWAILEPVDAHGRAVPEGQACHTTLLTNLANHVQPLIRYDLGDRVRFVAEPCPCGSALPVIEVEGRVDDALLLDDARGGKVRLLPLALTTLLEDDAGVFEFQLVQNGARRLCLTIGADGGPGGDGGDATCERAHAVLSGYLRRQGLQGCELEVRRGAPAVRQRSGKVPRVARR